jgi:hypothetical protein
MSYFENNIQLFKMRSLFPLYQSMDAFQQVCVGMEGNEKCKKPILHFTFIFQVRVIWRLERYVCIFEVQT